MDSTCMESYNGFNKKCSYRLHALGSQQRWSLRQLNCILQLVLRLVPHDLSERYVEEPLVEAFVSAMNRSIAKVIAQMTMFMFTKQVFCMHWHFYLLRAKVINVD